MGYGIWDTIHQKIKFNYAKLVKDNDRRLCRMEMGRWMPRIYSSVCDRILSVRSGKLLIDF